MEFYTFSKIEFNKMLKEAAQAGALAALTTIGIASPTITRSDAMKLHGQRLIEALEKEGLITKRQRLNRGHYYYDANELNSAIISENRHRFFKGNN